MKFSRLILCVTLLAAPTACQLLEETHGAPSGPVEGTSSRPADRESLQPAGVPEDGKSGKEGKNNTTPYSGFGSGVVTSFSLTVITEFGDRTFFLAALMSLKYGKIPVAIGSISALVAQTVLSIVLGRLLHCIPNSSSRALSAIPLDDYGAAVMLFIFGWLHLRAAYHTPPVPQPSPSATVVGEDIDMPLSTAPQENVNTQSGEYLEAKETVERVQYMDLGLRPATLSIIKKTFWIVFIAEVGDKSMISTIALATAQNPWGVLLGAAAAHSILTVAAVIAGSLLENYISDRLANVVGGCLFLAYALLTAAEGLARQGVSIWGFSPQQASSFLFAYFTAAAVSSTTTLKDTSAGFLRGFA